MPSEKATLKLVKSKSATQNGISIILLKVPGDSAKGEGRVVESGICWFLSPHVDDYVEVYITDEDNILGYGAGFVIASYTETELNADNKGWFFPPSEPILKASALGDFGFIPSGFYLKIIATKGNSLADVFYCNIKWGKK